MSVHTDVDGQRKNVHEHRRLKHHIADGGQFGMGKGGVYQTKKTLEESVPGALQCRIVLAARRCVKNVAVMGRSLGRFTSSVHTSAKAGPELTLSLCRSLFTARCRC